MQGAKSIQFFFLQYYICLYVTNTVLNPGRHITSGMTRIQRPVNLTYLQHQLAVSSSRYAENRTWINIHKSTQSSILLLAIIIEIKELIVNKDCLNTAVSGTVQCSQQYFSTVLFRHSSHKKI